jgi:hypothetical protein
MTVQRQRKRKTRKQNMNRKIMKLLNMKNTVKMSGKKIKMKLKICQCPGQDEYEGQY